MKDQLANTESTLCPSAQPETPGSMLFGIVGGTAAEPRLMHLAKPQPVSDEILALAGPVKPTEVFRFAAPCAGSACAHFESGRCRLAQQILDGLPAVVEQLPRCVLRPNCRWYQQEGREACLRCPQIVTEPYNATSELIQIAKPTGG